MGWGIFVMAPWAGRVRHGRFTHEGREYALPIDLPPHAIHGTVYQRAWQLEARDEASATLRCDLGDAWPFPGFVRQRIGVRPDGVAITLGVFAAKRPFPASAGFHPWFRRELGAGRPLQLEFEAARMYQRDDEGIPTGALIAPPAPPYDDCFCEVLRGPLLRWADALEVRLESSADHWVVYDEPVHAICVEPQTGPPDALNIAPRIVRPGEPLELELRLSWRTL